MTPTQDRLINRRMFVRGLLSLASGLIIETHPFVFAQSGTALPDGIGILPDYDGPVPSLGTLGRIPALSAEVRVANAILAAAPISPTTPFNVASYFLDVGSGKLNPSWRPYVQGWPERWNPVIVTFFQATDTKPEGDLTSWCAAFVNWCFIQSGRGVATHSASSGSFRSFGDATSTPKPGDIVVFKSADPELAKKGRGHVGFFVSDHGTTVEVLGGNQIQQHESSHMICKQLIRKQSNALILQSYRAISSLR